LNWYTIIVESHAANKHYAQIIHIP